MSRSRTPTIQRSISRSQAILAANFRDVIQRLAPQLNDVR